MTVNKPRVLLTCPFCNGRAHLSFRFERSTLPLRPRGFWSVTCSGKWGDAPKGCGARGPERAYAANAVKLWNARAFPGGRS